MITKKGRRLVDEGGSDWVAKGVAVHGVLHEEVYSILCCPETMLYEQTQVRMGKEASDAWWDRKEKATFDETDAAWLESKGFNSIRVSFSWRRFTERTEDFHRILDLCRRHNLKCIFELHAAPGGQNPDNHGDSMAMRGQFWEFEELQYWVKRHWGYLASSLHSHGTELLGYEILNEPVTTIRHTSAFAGSCDDWYKLNNFYDMCIHEIRKHDPNRLILIDGDWYSEHYDGLELPDDPNLCLSPHQYVQAAMNPDHAFDEKEVAAEIFRRPVWNYAEKHNLPMLWTEFGPMSTPDRDYSHGQLRATRMQKNVYAEKGSGWFYWTYKDTMGLLRPRKWEEKFAALTAARLALGADNLGPQITPGGFIKMVADQLDRYTDRFSMRGQNLKGVPGMLSVLEKYLRRAAQEGIVYEWGQMVQDNPDWVDLWKIEYCEEQTRVLEALFG